jgi:UDP-N-acetylglucosamine 4,6-dehydratase/5-epimerase
VDTAEDNPIACADINIEGAKNVVHAALANRVEKVFHISTDKAVYPSTLYGSTKKVAEDILIQANVYREKDGPPMFSCARYGNVFGSRGSVIHTFKQQAEEGVLTVTDQRMTRFWITVAEVSRFILNRIDDMKGGEIFVPNMPSMSVMDIAKTVAPDAEIQFTGIRGQEKIHECLITEEESIYTFTYGPEEGRPTYFEINKGGFSPGKDRWTYCSGDNPWQLTRDELRQMLEDL